MSLLSPLDATREPAPIDLIFKGLMRRYMQRVPDVQRIVAAMITDGLIGQVDDIINDHVAFRTMGVEGLGIQSLEKIFLHYGYQKKDDYHFKQKKLDAYWYSPPASRTDLPRVFISELRVDDLSADAQGVIRRYTDQVEGDPVDAIDLADPDAVDHFLHHPLWSTPTWEVYAQLREETEYGAWVLYNRYYLNHFTISVHALPKPYDTIEQFNTFLTQHGIVLNDANGVIKTSADGMLIQSATVAQKIETSFPTESGDQRSETIAGSYVEFAQRDLLPGNEDDKGEMAAKRRDGFDAGNADGIFESTFTTQTMKRDENPT